MAMKYAKRLAHRIIEGQAFVVDPKAKVLHSLNGVGSRVWQLLGSGAAPETIAKTLAEEFDVDYKTALEDVKAFIKELASKKLVEA